MSHLWNKEFYDHDEFFDHLLDTYGEALKRLIYTYVKNYSVTDDLAQEVFISVYHSIDQFKGESHIKTWLFRIAINKCKDYLKSPKHQQHKFLDRLNIIGNFLTGGKSTEEIVLKKERESELIIQVMNLPVKYREVVIHYYYYDFTIEEISNVLSVNMNTVKTRLRRAKKRLKEQLLETGGDVHEY